MLYTHARTHLPPPAKPSASDKHIAALKTHAALGAHDKHTKKQAGALAAHDKHSKKQAALGAHDKVGWVTGFALAGFPSEQNLLAAVGRPSQPGP